MNLQQSMNFLFLLLLYQIYFKISTNLDIPTDDESNPYLITYKFFEDDWTKYGKDKTLISNTQRYKCLGNAVTTNVIQYIVNNWKIR